MKTTFQPHTFQRDPFNSCPRLIRIEPNCGPHFLPAVLEISGLYGGASIFIFCNCRYTTQQSFKSDTFVVISAAEIAFSSFENKPFSFAPYFSTKSAITSNCSMTGTTVARPNIFANGIRSAIIDPARISVMKIFASELSSGWYSAIYCWYWLERDVKAAMKSPSSIGSLVSIVTIMCACRSAMSAE